MVLTPNERKLLLYLWRHAGERYSINQLAKSIGITQRGAFKILQKFEREGLVIKEKIANSLVHTLNFTKAEYIIKYLLKGERPVKDSVIFLEKELQGLRNNTKTVIVYTLNAELVVFIVTPSKDSVPEIKLLMDQIKSRVRLIVHTLGTISGSVEFKEALHLGHILWGYDFIYSLVRALAIQSLGIQAGDVSGSTLSLPTSTAMSNLSNGDGLVPNSKLNFPTEQLPTEQPSTGQLSTGQPSPEQPSAEQLPTEQPSAEQLPAEQPSAEQLPTEQPSPEQLPTEQPSAEQPLLEAVPSLENSTNDKNMIGGEDLFGGDSLVKPEKKISPPKENTNLNNQKINEHEDLKDSDSGDTSVATRYLAIIENSHDLVFTLDLSGKFTYVNRIVTSMLGYTQIELLSIVFMDIVSKTSRELIKDWLHILSIPRKFRNLEVDLVKKDGRVITCSLNVFPFPTTGNVRQIHVVAREITEIERLRKQKQKLQEKLFKRQQKQGGEIQRSRRFTDLILANIPSALVILDDQLTFSSANSRYYSLFHKTPLQLLDKPVSDVFTGFPSFFFNRLRKVLTTNLQEHLEVRVGDRYFLVNINNISNFNQTKRQREGSWIMIILFDITERKKTELLMVKELEHRREIAALHKMDSMKTDFLNLTSHELKTPLTPTLIQAQLLSEDALGKLNPMQKKSTTIIIRNMKQLERLIDDVLDISRIQSGTLKLELVKDSLAKLITEEVEGFKLKAGSGNIFLELNISPLTPLFYDDGRIRQVIRNLVRNALKFTPSGGKIIISAKQITRFIQVNVSDTGAGIAKRNLPLVFTPFFQVQPSYKLKEKGRGLGLSICKGIINGHGGKIWVESKGLGKGTTFSFTLPLRKITLSSMSKLNNKKKRWGNHDSPVSIINKKSSVEKNIVKQSPKKIS